MYVNDPFDLVNPPVLEEDELELEEPRDYHEFFFDDIRLYPDNTHAHTGIHVGVCRFNEKGEHVYMAKSCPHYDQVDEEGPRIKPDWTVQSR